MNENRTWIIVIGCVALGGMGFASFAKEMQIAVLVGGFASSICVSLLTLLKTNQTADKQDVAIAKVDVAARKAEHTANLVQENAVAVDERLVHLSDVVTETKKGVEKVEIRTNSATGTLLRRSADILRRFANSTKDPVDEAVAVSAERDYEEHERGQAIIAAAAGNPPLLGVSKRLEATAGLMGIIEALPPAPGKEAMEKIIPEGTIGKEEKP